MTEIKEVIKKTQYSFTVKIKPNTKNSIDIDFTTYATNPQGCSGEELWEETRKNVIKINDKYLYCNDIAEKIIATVKEVIKELNTDIELNVRKIINIK
jgi:hypothetical protein